MLEQYLRHVEQTRAPLTYLAQKTDLEQFLPLLEQYSLQEAIESYFKKNQNWKTSTLNRKAETLRSFLSWLEANGYVEKGAQSMVPKTKRLTVNIGDGYFPSEEEINKLLEVSEQSPLRDKLILRMILYMGLRPHQITSLRIEDVSPDCDLLRIDDREVEVHPEVRAYLKAYTDALLVGSTREEKKQMPLFSTNRGNVMNRVRVSAIIKELAKRAGLKGQKLGPNKLRRKYVLEVVRKADHVTDVLKQGISRNAYYTFRASLPEEYQETQEIPKAETQETPEA
ncbi:MAG: tyrosine-type recombinase/integrase [Candidatus Methanomethylicaceae archaeon]